MTRHERSRLIVDPGSRVLEQRGAWRNSIGSNHVGVQHVSVYPNDRPNTRNSYHGLVVGPCVHVVAYTPKEEFVFIEEQRPLATTKGTVVRKFLGFPGGFADGGSANLATEAARELAEEAGITTYDSLTLLRQGKASDPSYQPYPQLSDEATFEFFAPGAVLARDEDLADLRAGGESTEKHLQVVTMPIPQIERILSGQEAARVPFSGPAISTLYMAQLAIRNL